MTLRSLLAAVAVAAVPVAFADAHERASEARAARAALAPPPQGAGAAGQLWSARTSFRSPTDADDLAPDGLLALEGALHEHSGYSDGWPGSIPADYYAAGRRAGLDFLAGSEHSDNANLPLTASEECLGPDPTPCITAQDGNGLRKWDASLEQADTAQAPGYSTIRGFEWTSDRFGHINVYFSRNHANAKADGGYAAMRPFYDWLTRLPTLGGGADGLATFNHPDTKKLADQDPGRNWDDFAYDPRADAQMVGVELFNVRRDHAAFFHRALDRGWHVGAVGAEDVGHDRSDDWGGAQWAKTVVLASENSRAGLRAAMADRRMYAIRNPGIRLTLTLDGELMGARLVRRPGETLDLRAEVRGVDGARTELVTSGGRVVADGDETLREKRPAAASERYYFLRVRAADRVVAVSSPIWVTAAAGRSGAWYAGDLHVHTCHSHDVYCGLQDDNTGSADFYTAGLTVGQRFAEAAARGLDFLAITDHNDVRSVSDPEAGTGGVLPVPGYEASLRGHAQFLGARRLHDTGDGSAAAVGTAATALRDGGGAFQANHPGYKMGSPFASCSSTDVLDWGYGYEVRPDTIEVWNPTSPMREAEAYWECWLARGAMIGATGGSDAHWASLSVLQGSGNPTTWVFAADRTPRAILRALRAGRTTLSRTPPTQGPARLLLEADDDGDGIFESAIGDTVAPGVPMRVRLEGGAGAGLVRVRANGSTIVADEPLASGRPLTFRAPSGDGWVRATLSPTGGATQGGAACEPRKQPASTCPYDHQVLAMTSPLYVRSDGERSG